MCVRAFRHADTIFVFATIAAAPSPNGSTPPKMLTIPTRSSALDSPQIREVIDRQNAGVGDFDADLARDAGLVVDRLEGQVGGRVLAVDGELSCK